MVKTTIAENLCEDNDIYIFDCSKPAGKDVPIGGISFACRPAVLCDSQGRLDSTQFQQADIEATHHVQNTLLPILKKQIWVFLSTDWGPPDRITSHLKLWGHLKTQERLDLAGFELKSEVEFKYDGEVCYAGVMNLASTGFPAVAGVLRNRDGFALLSDRDEIASAESIASLFESAHAGNRYVNWQVLAESVCPLGDIVLRIPPITDIPPHSYESALDFFLLTSDLMHLRNLLG